MHLHDFLLGLVALVSEVLGTLSGFGSSTFFVPAALFFESFHVVLALTALLHCFGNISKLALFRSAMNWDLFLKLAIPSILFTAIGAWLSNKVPIKAIERVLGALLVLIPLLKWTGIAKKRKISIGLGVGVVALSGFLTGLVGTGGALRGIALSALHVQKNSFVLLSAAIDLGGDLIRATIYLLQGYMDWSQWFYLPILVVGAVLGSWVGKQILKRIKQSQFEILVSIFVFLSGLTMLIGKRD